MNGRFEALLRASSPIAAENSAFHSRQLRPYASSSVRAIAITGDSLSLNDQGVAPAHIRAIMKARRLNALSSNDQVSASAAVVHLLESPDFKETDTIHPPR
jgi:hypothetical protein